MFPFDTTDARFLVLLSMPEAADRRGNPRLFMLVALFGTVGTSALATPKSERPSKIDTSFIMPCLTLELIMLLFSHCKNFKTTQESLEGSGLKKWYAFERPTPS